MVVELAPVSTDRDRHKSSRWKKSWIKELRIRLSQDSENVGRIVDFADNLFIQISSENPNVTSYDLMSQAVDQSPKQMPLEAQEKAIRATTSLDANTRRLGKKAFLYLNMKTLLSVVDLFYIKEIDSSEDRDEMLTSAMAYSVEKIDAGMPIDTQIPGRMHRFAKDGVIKFLTEKENMPAGLIRNRQDRLFVQTKIKEFESESPTRGSIEKLTGEISEHAGFVNERKRKEVLNWLMFLNAQRKEERKKALLEQGEDTYFSKDPALELREEVGEAFNALSPREKRIIELRFGLEEGSKPEILEEVGRDIGVTRERIRQIEAKILRRLRSLS